MLDLKQYFTAAKVAKVLETAPPLESTVMDDLFTDRPIYDGVVVPVQEVFRSTKPMPLVARGAASVPLDGEKKTTMYMEALSVHLSDGITAHEWNNLKQFTPESVQDWANRRILAGRESCRATTEVLCSQAVFDGMINYPLKLESGGFATKEVYYGDIEDYSSLASEKWDESDFTIIDAYTQIDDMVSELKGSGVGGDIAIYAGSKAYATLLKLAASKENNLLITLGKGVVDVGGYEIKRMSEEWENPETKVMTPKIPEDEIRLVAKRAQSLIYGCIDDFRAGGKPIPLFSKVIEKQDPSERRILVKSAVMPCVSARATAKAVVLS